MEREGLWDRFRRTSAAPSSAPFVHRFRRPRSTTPVEQAPQPSAHPQSTAFHGSGNSGVQVGQNYGTVNVMQAPRAQHAGDLSREETCLQLFRLSKQGGGGTYEWYKNRVEDRVAGTCQWFLNHPSYIAWKESTVPAPLLVSADPGCGKSVLAKHLINEQTSGMICYYFFKDQDQNTLVQCLCALLHQLFTQDQLLICHALPHYATNGPDLVHNVDLLQRIFTDIFTSTQTGPVTIVLDALDECLLSDLTDLIRLLRTVLREAQRYDVKIKFLLTSRPYQNVLSQFWSLTEDFPQIRIPGEEHSKEISEEVNHVIRYRVAQLARKFQLKEQLREHLEQRLLSMTHRTYLWAYLAFDHLEKGFIKSTKGIQKVIDTLPENVGAAYEKILEKSTDKIKARLTLSIMLVASRPFTLEEMNMASNVEQVSEARSWDELGLEDDEDFRDTLRDWCGLFVSIYANRVYFLHQTAREFLLSTVAASQGHSESWHWRNSISTGQAHALLAGSCVTYLHFSNICKDTADEIRVHSEEPSLTPVVTFEKSKFFRYAALEWIDHYRMAEDKILPETTALAGSICKLNKGGTPTWFLLLRKDTPNGPFDGWCPLKIASSLALESIVGGMINDTNVNEPDPSGETPLFYAVSFNLPGIVHLLLDKGADINHENETGNTPLHTAISFGDINLTGLLLKRGANVNAKNGRGDTPLHVIQRGHQTLSMVSLLLDHNADINAAGWNGKTPLLCLHHFLEVHYLLERGASINACYQDGKTLLHVSARHGSDRLLESLLRHGAEIDARDARGFTPLLYAAYYGQFRTGELLLLHGADPNACDYDGYSILSYAREGRNDRTVDFLLAHGARLALPDSDDAHEDDGREEKIYVHD